MNETARKYNSSSTLSLRELRVNCKSSNSERRALFHLDIARVAISERGYAKFVRSRDVYIYVLVAIVSAPLLQPKQGKRESHMFFFFSVVSNAKMSSSHFRQLELRGQAQNVGHYACGMKKTIMPPQDSQNNGSTSCFDFMLHCLRVCDWDLNVNKKFSQ